MSRDAILARVRKNTPDPIPLPERFDQGLVYENRAEQFEQSLVSVHAEVASYAAEADFKAAFPNLFPAAEKVYSQLEALHTFSADTPRGYEHLDVAVYRGRLGVAENGAIFVDFGNEQQRSQAVLAQTLCLVVRREDLVDNMHQAYRALDDSFPDYGVFISGPSKTADIEQSLVIGAHGACSLTVAVIEG